jgi:hypothetical protein
LVSAINAASSARAPKAVMASVAANSDFMLFSPWVWSSGEDFRSADGPAPIEDFDAKALPANFHKLRTTQIAKGDRLDRARPITYAECNVWMQWLACLEEWQLVN